MSPSAVATQLAADFQTHWNAHDMDAFGELFDEGATFVNRYGMLWVGREAIRAGHRYIHEGVYRDTTVDNEVVRAEEIAQGVVTVHMLSRMTMGPAMPYGPRAVNTLLLLVATERGGGWRIRSAENVAVTDPTNDQPILAWPHPFSPLPE